jgi:octanoyl-[GcvH]:protein N-octanoyltransferase
MSNAFGPQRLSVALPPGQRTGPDDMELVRDRLTSLRRGGDAQLTIARADATAAFSRRDTLLGGYADAEALAGAHGFTPILRPVGGHLAVYDEGALLVHLSAPHTEARLHIRERFEVVGGALAIALRAMGVDARVGPVPGEYCDGEFSVNASGRTKLAGTGQRITRSGYLFSAVVMVEEVARVCDVLAPAYRALGLSFRPETVGCVADSVPGVTLDEVRGQLLAALSDTLPLAIGSGAELAESA